LRISLDAKSPVKIGEFSRRGKSRVRTEAADHDFPPDEVLTPFGILLPKTDDLFLYFTPSTFTADFVVDTICDWWKSIRPRFPQVRMLVINLDNGPEQNSRRTQFVKRMVDFVSTYQVAVRLAYYPPYHSKYNPIERCWGILENHWNGSLLDSRQAALGFARSMTWNSKHPVVRVAKGTYETGKRLTPSAMSQLENKLDRLPELPKWFVDIRPRSETLAWDN
jgi:transposase